MGQVREVEGQLEDPYCLFVGLRSILEDLI
jgi:hypothetical protein